jgi:methylthioribose-1-phosphate isomerase
MNVEPVAPDTAGNMHDKAPTRTLWLVKEKANWVLYALDQRKIPFATTIVKLTTVAEVTFAIKDMVVRGAGCIGVTAGYGMVLAAQECAGDRSRWVELAALLKASRPTAVNLAWAVDRQLAASAQTIDLSSVVHTAELIAKEDVAACAAIGLHGLEMILQLRAQQGKRADEVTHILTHCNAGWLAFVEHGSATAPIYAAHAAGIPIHVWVDETRPRNQGARLTAWELQQSGVPHHVIVDNAGGHLMQRGQVDLVITGADRVTRTGDVANKIGTYLKALAAHDLGIPFYVALPSSTFDWNMRDGLAEIPIEERSPDEVTMINGTSLEGDAEISVAICAKESTAFNPSFDVTPARLVTGFISERGICAASEESISKLYPEATYASF